MKTKELIELLHCADPNGNLEVTLEGKNLYSVDTIPGQCDGYYEKIFYDEDGNPEYGILSGEGTEIRLTSFTLEDVIFDIESKPGGYFPVCVVDHYGNREYSTSSYRKIPIIFAKQRAANYLLNKRMEDAKKKLRTAYKKSSWEK